MSDLNYKNEVMKQKMMSIADDETKEWLQDRSKEFVRLMTYYKCALLEMETKFKVLDAEYSLANDRNPINSIKTRLKSFPSIADKLQRKGLSESIESMEQNINDIAGIRVVCAFQEDVYTLANALLQQDDVILISQKDYIAHPKENGYKSLHMIVTVPIFLAEEKRMMKVEIQLRTIAMDSWASLEHQLRYKKDSEFTEEMAEELLDCARLSSELDTKMDRLRMKVHSK